MAAEKRKFRTDASLDVERKTRAAVIPFLAARGFSDIADERTVRGSAVTQVIRATDRDGEKLRMHVRLCWRREGRSSRELDYSAAQLRARLIRADWNDTLNFIAERDRQEGNTHTLILQFGEGSVVSAALIPCEAVGPIWQAQRAVSDQLIAAGKTGRMKKNHATNGSSPTIWLQDDRAPHTHAVADVLWSWPGVENLTARVPTQGDSFRGEDSLDDCPADHGHLGRDSAPKALKVVSGYPRDARVRAEVIRRAQGTCERGGCSQQRGFPGFLDVHHILGIGFSDRVWNCVALCPNCHREAHFSPERDAINRELFEYASRLHGARAASSKMLRTSACGGPNPIGRPPAT